MRKGDKQLDCGRISADITMKKGFDLECGMHMRSFEIAYSNG